MSTEIPPADACIPFARHVLETPFEALPESAIDRAKVFILDSLGVGIAGSTAPHAGALTDMLHAARPAQGGARPLGQAVRLGGPDCAFLNAFQIHNAEYDCVHEGAVVHPMAVLLGSLLADIDRSDRAISGRDLLAAVVLGVDAAAGLGLASRSALKFFRPATAGGLAAPLALARLNGLSQDIALDAMGLAYAQLGGTMQAHTEGLPLLAMQVGFNARNALWALDMARAGVPGTRGTLSGPYGYLNLFESDTDVAPVIDSLGKIWRIEEVAHKPFPSGRATHGIVDGCLRALGELGLECIGGGEVAGVNASVPSLTHRLIGRPVNAQMTPNYARLCGQFVTARLLMRGHLDLTDFGADALADEEALKLAEQVSIGIDENPDPNALAPVEVVLRLNDGKSARVTVDTVYGHPDRPMTREAQLAKFAHNWEHAAANLVSSDRAIMINKVSGLEEVDDCRELIALCVEVLPARAPRDRSP